VVQFLPQLGQPAAVPDDIVLDILFQIPHSSDAALEQRMQDDFLVDGINVAEHAVALSRLTSEVIFFPYFSDKNCIVLPTFNKYSEATPVSMSKAIFDVPGTR
jgi:hypothetical protein